MKQVSFKLEFDIRNSQTDEVYDHQALDFDLGEKMVKNVAEAMNMNGGYAPELDVCEELSNFLYDECIFYYTKEFAPEDDAYFWDDYYLDLGNIIPQPIVSAAEQFVTHKDVDIACYSDNGSKSVEISLKPEIYQAMTKAAKQKKGSGADFDFLKMVNPNIYNKVKAQIEKEHPELGSFILQEFPYQILEEAVYDDEDDIEEEVEQDKSNFVSDEKLIKQEMPEQSIKERFREYLFSQKKEAIARIYISMIDHTLRRFVKKEMDSNFDSIYSFTTPETFADFFSKLIALPRFTEEDEQRHHAISEALSAYELFLKEQ